MIGAALLLRQVQHEECEGIIPQLSFPTLSLSKGEDISHGSIPA
jgi:hypothetical protein